ncbi:MULTISPECIES: YqiA/YcfP family alpha/beta fold hydrolase [unclassified Psychrobacter]|uniref:YqiA/YcfP family alpha/beta fold hydrolase n=1 Tax=unclassified Psychrobacter TaxID=196806 RepID=UPI0025B44954|nr:MULTISPECIES: YqiA/YcfP family alpha/beta fold hydrolase [unclassified Psychrobacter]MDN3453161.1 YqiA/YcfP family alpha/beta fold hydrolase [Psychrobacter sp. APC 3350]MDN3503113.1 YqiA/YcfP family alpha/beta fold hydrolase [Psychrobacter sp. 5A.1]
MNLIYIHGLDSDANSTKGVLLEKYCQRHHPNINVLRPDLNKSPAQVCEKLLSLIKNLNNSDSQNAVNKHSALSNTVLVGSSLGGYFSTVISNQTGCAALLLNPSTQPYITLQRFSDTSISKQDDGDERSRRKVLYATAGGWDITHSDLQWFAEHQLSAVNYPNKMAVLLKEGDELLNAELANAFYQEQGVSVTVQAGGDHRFSDFGEQLPMVIHLLQNLIQG